MLQWTGNEWCSRRYHSSPSCRSRCQGPDYVPHEKLISDAYPLTQEPTYPSNTALPNGRVDELPPRNSFHTRFARLSAADASENPTCPVAPPSERVTILPFAWQASICDAMKEQSARSVPAKVLKSYWLQVWNFVGRTRGKIGKEAYVGEVNLWLTESISGAEEDVAVLGLVSTHVMGQAMNLTGRP